MVQGTLFDIKRFAIHDGPGIRTTVFLKGCPLDCWWCHNPEGRRPAPETMAAGPANDETVAVGCVMTSAEVMSEIEKDILFYDESGGGVTFSGGEPLLQPQFLTDLLAACRARGIHTALDTTGYAPVEILAATAPLVDLFLYDLKLLDDEAHQNYTGVSNRRILENLRFLAFAGGNIWIRYPLIPTVNDTPENLSKMKDFLDDLGLRRIDLLPYHRIHRQKYRRLGHPDRLGELRPPDQDAVARVRDDLETDGFTVCVGG